MPASVELHVSSIECHVCGLAVDPRLEHGPNGIIPGWVVNGTADSDVHIVTCPECGKLDGHIVTCPECGKLDGHVILETFRRRVREGLDRRFH